MAQAVVTTDLGDSATMRMLLPVGRSGLAIAAGYAGLFALLILPAPLALLLGLSLFEISGCIQRNMGWAVLSSASSWAQREQSCSHGF